MRRIATGFTLLEVLVALAIVATTVYSGYFLLNRTVANKQILQEKLLAEWIAMNTYADLELKEFETDQAYSEPVVVTMYGIEFLVEVSSEEIEGEQDGETEVLDKTIFNIAVFNTAQNRQLIEEISFERSL